LLPEYTIKWIIVKAFPPLLVFSKTVRRFIPLLLVFSNCKQPLLRVAPGFVHGLSPAKLVQDIIFYKLNESSSLIPVAGVESLPNYAFTHLYT